MEHCALILGKTAVGELSWTREGSLMALRARCPAETGWIYRVVICRGAETLPLGVMLPREGSFVLEKRLRAALPPESAFVDRTRPGESHLPGLPVALSAFSPEKGGVRRAWWREEEYALCPLVWGGECPLAACFSVLRPVETAEGWYALLTLRDGQPLPPQRDSFRTESGV